MSETTVQELTRRLLVSLGEDPEREGLKRTPERVERSLEFLTRGYHTSLVEILNDAVFEEECDEMVVRRAADRRPVARWRTDRRAARGPEH